MAGPYYAPSVGEIVLGAYSRLQIRGSALLAEHMFTARQEMNLMASEWSNKGPMLWTVDLLQIPLLGNVSTYDVDPATIAVLDVYVSAGLDTQPQNGGFSIGFDPGFNTGSVPHDQPDGTVTYTPGQGAFSDRILMPVSRTEWASYPNKFQNGFPSVFWFDRLVSPTITVWPVPPRHFNGILNVYRWSQTSTAETRGAPQINIPYRYLDAGTAGLSHRLSRHYAPALEGIRKTDAIEAWNTASEQDREQVNMYIAPMTSSYWRT